LSTKTYIFNYNIFSNSNIVKKYGLSVYLNYYTLLPNLAFPRRLRRLGKGGLGDKGFKKLLLAAF